MAMFAALAYGVTFVFRIPVQFLTFDAKDAVISIASFIYGPTSAIVISLIAAFIEFFIQRTTVDIHIRMMLLNMLVKFFYTKIK